MDTTNPGTGARYARKKRPRKYAAFWNFPDTEGVRLQIISVALSALESLA